MSRPPAGPNSGGVRRFLIVLTIAFLLLFAFFYMNYRMNQQGVQDEGTSAADVIAADLSPSPLGV